MSIDARGRVGAALGRTIAVGADEFAAMHWGRAPLLSRAAELAGPDGFTDLLSPAAVDELLGRRGLRAWAVEARAALAAHPGSARLLLREPQQAHEPVQGVLHQPSRGPGTATERGVG